jgi:hypothetical protein
VIPKFPSIAFPTFFWLSNNISIFLGFCIKEGFQSATETQMEKHVMVDYTSISWYFSRSSSKYFISVFYPEFEVVEST